MGSELREAAQVVPVGVDAHDLHVVSPAETAIVGRATDRCSWSMRRSLGDDSSIPGGSFLPKPGGAGRAAGSIDSATWPATLHRPLPTSTGRPSARPLSVRAFSRPTPPCSPLLPARRIARGPDEPSLTTASVRAAVALQIPDDPLIEGALIAHLQSIIDNSVRTGSGGFLAYIPGAGRVPGAIDDLLASGLNSNPGGWALSAAPTEVEPQLMWWLADRFGPPPRCSTNP